MPCWTTGVSVQDLPVCWQENTHVSLWVNMALAKKSHWMTVPHNHMELQEAWVLLQKSVSQRWAHPLLAGSSYIFYILMHIRSFSRKRFSYSWDFQEPNYNICILITCALSCWVGVSGRRSSSSLCLLNDVSACACSQGPNAVLAAGMSLLLFCSSLTPR